MTQTTFQLVADMNVAFGNPKGSWKAGVDWEKLESSARNILDEYNELLEAIAERDDEGVRDALCDIQVFACGCQHMIGVDGDADMQAVIDGVMTRFIKNHNDMIASVEYHRKRGVEDVAVFGEYPRAVLRSMSHQPDAPKGKFLKSISYAQTIFPPVAG